MAQYGLSCSTAGGIIAGPRIKPVSPALAGGFFTTEPPGNAPISFWNKANNYPVLGVTPLTSFHSVCPCTGGVRWAPLSSLKFRKVKCCSWRHGAKRAQSWDSNPGLVGLSCSRIPPLLPLPLEGTRWPFPLLWNRCSHSTCLTELSLPRRPLKPASTPDALLVTASHSPHARLLFLFSASTSSCSARPQSSCPVRWFPGCPYFAVLSSLLRNAPPPNSSPRQYPHHVQPTQTFTTWYTDHSSFQ